MKDEVNGQIAKWMKIAIEIGILLFAVGIAWSTLRSKVDTNLTTIEKHEVRIDKVEVKTSDIKSDIREIKVMQGVALEKIKELKEK